MKYAQIRKQFESFLRGQSLKLTAQRARIFERVFATHDHFTAESLYRWLQDEEGPRVSRATVYRTLGLLVDGGFLESLDVGLGELRYEHVTGHKHHDHMVCMDCGKIDEFVDERIEALQKQAADAAGFVMVTHDLRLLGYCKSCARVREKKGEDLTSGQPASTEHAH